MEILIFMLLSPILATIEVLKGKFEHVVHEILPRTCAWIGFKFYNKQTVEAVIKKWECFTKVLTYDCLWNEASPNKFHRQEKDSFGFWVKLMIELGFQFKNFCIGNRQDGLFHVKFWIFLESVW